MFISDSVQIKNTASGIYHAAYNPSHLLMKLCGASYYACIHVFYESGILPAINVRLQYMHSR